MLIPVRCFTCGKPIAHLWEEYKKKVADGEDPKKVLDELGLERYCCKAPFIGNAELLEEISAFKKA